MARRWLRDTILTSESVDKLEPPAEVFYRRLMSVVDDYGRYDARPAILRAACYPLRLDKIRETDISRSLAACQSAGLIALYEVESKPYLVLLKLGEPRAVSSKFPRPPATCIAKYPEGSIPVEPFPDGGDSVSSANGREQVRADAPALRITPSPHASRRGGGRGNAWAEKMKDLRPKGNSHDTATGN